jgi:hypothetical protein
MKPKLASAVTGMAFAIALLAATPASAATEVGNDCLGNQSGGGTPISLANAPGSPLPATIPHSGVITRWRVTVIPIPEGVVLTETLKIFRPTGTPKQFQVVGESNPVLLTSGTSNHAARIPVQAGDHIGGSINASGDTGGLYCKTDNPGDVVGLFAENPPNGSTATTLGEQSGYQVPLVVTVEADADGDGFGDETQDECPQSATTQSACPPLVISALKQVKKGAVIVFATASTASPLTVKGVVPLGKGKKANLGGGTQNVAPGTFVRFKLQIPKRAKAKLAGLSRKKSLTLTATVTGTGISGAVTTRVLKIKLRGLQRS